MKTSILRPEEYAQCLGIGRTTLFDWMKRGYLIEGRDYFRIERTLRFVWDDETPRTLMRNLNMPREEDSALN